MGRGARPLVLARLTARLRWEEPLSAGEKLRAAMPSTQVWASAGRLGALGPGAESSARDFHFRCSP